MRPIIGTFFGGKKSTQSPPLPIATFNYTFVNGSGATKVASGTRPDGTQFLQILTLGQSTNACLFEGTERLTGVGGTITKGAAC
jgi:hypothetical protein